MKKLIGVIFAILITVFAVMPNAYAEVQKDYGNLDMSRWVLLGRTEDSDVLIDKKSVDYYIDYKDDLLCNFWVCHFSNNENKYRLENVTISYINPIEKTIEVSTSSKENTNLSTRNTLLPVAMTGSFDIWEEIVLVADALNENSDSNNTNGVGDGNWINVKNTGGNSNNTNSTGSSNSTTITNTVTKYSFSISIEGVSKDGSKAKETE